MSVTTVKVACGLAFFILLLDFLDNTVAKDPNEGEFNVQHRAEDPYSEFIDDPPERSYSEGGHPEYDREGRSSEELEFQEKKQYENEQYWNQDDVEVEEDTFAPDKSSGKYREDPRHYKKTKSRKVRQLIPEVRYENHRYEDLDHGESRRVPKRKSVQYEVYEVVEDEELHPAETKLQAPSVKPAPPDRLVYQGYKYVKVRDGQDEHYHRVPGTAGSPPAARYSKDLVSAETGKPKSYQHSSGGDKDHHQKHYSAHGHKDDKGYKSSHHNEHGAKGKEGHDKHSKQYNEHGGKKHSDIDEAGHYGEHQEAAHGQKGGKFDEKKAQKKGHNTKGYHNKYHKDEYHKEHKFYDDYHKSGSHLRYGDFKGNHDFKDGGHKKNYHLDSSQHEDNAGKKGQHSKGHVDEDHKAYKNEKGYEKHHDQYSDYGKKGGQQGGQVYGYEKKH